MNSKLGDSNLPNWKQSAEAIETDQEQKIDDNTKRINGLETKTHYPMLNIDDLETEDAYITTLNVASMSNLHDVSADDISCIDCSVSGTLSAEFVDENLINLIFKSIYPIDSIYVSYNPMSQISGATRTTASTSQTIIYSWHDCEFEYIPDNLFLINAGTAQGSVITPDETTDTYYTEETTNPRTGGEATHTLTIDEMPSHTHTFEALNTFNTGNSSATFQAVAGNNAGGSTTWSAPVSTRNTSAGSSQPHNNLPPYLTCYMYKRIA